MQEFLSILNSAKTALQIDMNIYGFSFSWWDILLWGLVASLLGAVLWRFFGD